MAKNDLTPKRVQELLDYNPNTGQFTWRVDRPRRKAGTVAGCFDKALGYWRICIQGQVLYAHRLAWAWMTGEHPSHPIDHVNGMRFDNRWGNLRLAVGNINVKNRTSLVCVPWKRQVRKRRDGVISYYGYTSDPKLSK